MALLIGVTLALAIGAFARCLGLDRDRAFYPTILMVIASYYVLFAVVGDPAALLAEGLVCVGFVVLAGIGFKKSPWVIVIALIAHGIFDGVHPHVLENGGVPVWWPEFCRAYDIIAGAFLALRQIRTRRLSRRGSFGGRRPGIACGG